MNHGDFRKTGRERKQADGDRSTLCHSPWQVLHDLKTLPAEGQHQRRPLDPVPWLLQSQEPSKPHLYEIACQTDQLILSVSYYGLNPSLTYLLNRPKKDRYREHPSSGSLPKYNPRERNTAHASHTQPNHLNHLSLPGSARMGSSSSDWSQE